MSREEFLEKVRTWASKQGVPSLTARQLRDLVDERVVPGPTRQPQAGRRTPLWRWSHKSYRAAQLVCWLRGHGAKTFAEIRVLIWSHGRAAFCESVRADLLRAFRPLRKQMNATAGTDGGPVIGRDAASARVTTLARRLEQPSDLLRPPDFKLSPDQIVGAYDTMRFDSERAQLSTLIEAFGNGLGIAGTILQQFPQLNEIASGMFAGLIGDPQEIVNSAERTISETIPQSFVQARDVMRATTRAARSGPRILEAMCGSGAESWREPARNAAEALAWSQAQIVAFAQWLHWAHNASSREKAFFKNVNGGISLFRSAKGDDLAKIFAAAAGKSGDAGLGSPNRRKQAQ